MTKKPSSSNQIVPQDSKPLTAAILRLLMLGFPHSARSTRVTSNDQSHRIQIELAGTDIENAAAAPSENSNAFGKITIEHNRVKFDNAPWTRLPKGMCMQVSIAKGKLWLAAGPASAE